jgi:hypothetical protein
MVLGNALKRCLRPSIIQALRQLRNISRSKMVLFRLRLRNMMGLKIWALDDNTWFELQLRPQDALKYTGIRVPSLPPANIQMRYTDSYGRDNLQQAFSFYTYACTACRVSDINKPRIMDFGGGWGRISRLFFRETKPEHIWIIDCLSDSVYWLNATCNPCNIIMNDPLPPIVGLDTPLDLIYAFSVFSHLSEAFFHSWLSYLVGCLNPGGYLVFTTRGTQFIEQLRHHQRESRHSYLMEKLPHPEEVRTRYLKGEFQFYPIGGGGELTSDFYGEALIPRSYIEANYPSLFVSFTEEVEYVDQAVVVLQKTKE